MSVTRKWVAVCTCDLGATRFEVELEAPSYTMAILEAYVRLKNMPAGHPEDRAVIELYEKSLV